MTHTNALTKSYFISVDNTYSRVVKGYSISFEMPQTSADDNFRSQKEFDESPPLMFHKVNRNE